MLFKKNNFHRLACLLEIKEVRKFLQTKYYQNELISLKNTLNNFRDIAAITPEKICKPQILTCRFECQANVQTLPQVLRRSETCRTKKESYYRHIFNTHFNFSFRRPKTDTCDICDKFTIKIEHGSTEEKEKAEKEKKLQLHKAEAARFVKETASKINDDSHIAICFGIAIYRKQWQLLT